ncbi:hypothetical protein HID58_018725, partial [Brassica napus]
TTSLSFYILLEKNSDVANVLVLLSDLQSGRSSSTVEVRLLRFWEARNVRRSGELMGVDMHLLDSQVRFYIRHCERDDESNGNTFDWSEKRSSSQLKRAQERESIIPKRNLKFEMHKIVMVNGEMSLEPGSMGMKEWLKENVKEEEYVVMKVEVEVLEEMMRSKTIKWWISLLGMQANKAKGENMET